MTGKWQLGQIIGVAPGSGGSAGLEAGAAPRLRLMNRHVRVAARMMILAASSFGPSSFYITMPELLWYNGDMKKSKKVLFLIEQAGTLLQMPRSHVRTLGNAFDTIASHNYHVSMIAYCLARMEGLSNEDGMKALDDGITPRPCRRKDCGFGLHLKELHER